MHLLHSNISNLFTVCVLSYKIYCAYTPSNGAMALLNKISVFRILSLCLRLFLFLPLFVSVCPSVSAFLFFFLCFCLSVSVCLSVCLSQEKNPLLHWHTDPTSVLRQDFPSDGLPTVLSSYPAPE